MQLATITDTVLDLGYRAAGLMIGSLMALTLFILLGMGMLAISILVGYWRGQVMAGIRAAVLQLGLGSGLLLGMALAGILHEFVKLRSGQTEVLVLGAIVGGLAGAVFAALITSAIQIVAKAGRAWARERVHYQVSQSPDFSQTPQSLIRQKLEKTLP